MYPEALKRRTALASPIWGPDYLITHPLQHALEAACATLSGRVLDLGCGNRPYQSLLVHAQTYVGYDLDYQHTHPQVAGRAETLPFASRSFDGVLSTQVLEHVREPWTMLEEIARVLRPSGRVILSAPQAWRLHEEPHDYYRYTRYGLAHLLQRAGLRLVDCVPQGGVWRLLGQTFNNYLWQPRYAKGSWPWVIHRTVSVTLGTVVNLSAIALDRLAYDPGDTINYVVIAQLP